MRLSLVFNTEQKRNSFRGILTPTHPPLKGGGVWGERSHPPVLTFGGVCGSVWLKG